MDCRAAALALACGAALGCRSSSADPVSADEVRAAAIAAYQSGDAVAALQRLRAVVAAHPDDSLAYAYLADVVRRGGWTAEGYRLFGAAVAAHPSGGPELRYYLAFLAAYLGQPDSAEQWARDARAVRPPTYAEAVSLSDVLLLNQRFDAALALLEDATRRFPSRPEGRVRWTTLLARLGRFVDAQAAADRLVRDFPREPSALATAAGLRFMVGDVDGAETYTRRWLALTPGDAEARWNLVRIALRRGDWARADSALSDVVATGH